MADVQTLIDRNLEFAGSFDQGHLAILPRLSTLVLTCLDPWTMNCHRWCWIDI